MNYFKQNAASLIIGFVIPFLAVFVGIAFLGTSSRLVAGIPVAYLWLSIWFILTTVCLLIAWYGFDRKKYQK